MEVFERGKVVLSEAFVNLLPNSDNKIFLLENKLKALYPSAAVSDVTKADDNSKRLEVCADWDELSQIRATLKEWVNERVNSSDSDYPLNLKLSSGSVNTDESLDCSSCDPDCSLEVGPQKPHISRECSVTLKPIVIDSSCAQSRHIKISETIHSSVTSQAKRGRGRPVGSFKKKQHNQAQGDHQSHWSTLQGKRGSTREPECQSGDDEGDTGSPIATRPQDSEELLNSSFIQPLKRKRGRPVGSVKRCKKKQQTRSSGYGESRGELTAGINADAFTPRRRGRPRGSKNIPKSESRSGSVSIIQTRSQAGIPTRKKRWGDHDHDNEVNIKLEPEESEDYCVHSQTQTDGSSFMEEHQSFASTEFDANYNPETADEPGKEVPKELENYVTKEGLKYMCCNCDYKTFTFRYMKIHLQRAHMDKKHVCQECGKAFGLNKDLMVHALTHNKQHSCSQCNKKFSKSNLLEQHRVNVHELNRRPGRPCGSKNKKTATQVSYYDKVQCEHCDFQSPKFRSMKAHYQRHHEEKKFECSFCLKKFGLLKDLKQHVRFHTDRFPCDVCGKVLKSKYAMQLHKKRIHLKIPVPPPKSYQCEECGKLCRSRTDYQVHLNKVHLNERPFKCTECGMAFFAKANLKMHMLVHSDVFNFQCKVCGKRFRQRPGLRVHMFSHSGASVCRPFKCSVCNKGFTQKGALIRHERIHTGDRPYICKLCGAAFNDYSILRRHVLGIHKLDDQNMVRRTVQDAISTARNLRKAVEENQEKGCRGDNRSPDHDDVPEYPFPDVKQIEDQQRLMARELRLKYNEKKKTQEALARQSAAAQLLAVAGIQAEPLSDVNNIENVTVSRDQSDMKIEMKMKPIDSSSNPPTLITLLPRPASGQEDTVVSTANPTVASVIDIPVSSFINEHGQVQILPPVTADGDTLTTIMDVKIPYQTPLSQAMETPGSDQLTGLPRGSHVAQVDSLLSAAEIVEQGTEMEHIIVITNVNEDQEPDLDSILSSYQQQLNQQAQGTVQETPADIQPQHSDDSDAHSNNNYPNNDDPSENDNAESLGSSEHTDPSQDIDHVDITNIPVEI